MSAATGVSERRAQAARLLGARGLDRYAEVAFVSGALSASAK